jgi:hypothetical protein
VTKKFHLYDPDCRCLGGFIKLLIKLGVLDNSFTVKYTLGAVVITQDIK